MDKFPSKISVNEGVTPELISEMRKVYSSKDVPSMRKFMDEHPECDDSGEWVEPAETFIMNRKALFGGEGLFYAVLRGPGKVWIQTLPISRLAGRILSYGGGRRKEEGSILGGLGNLLDGD